MNFKNIWNANISKKNQSAQSSIFHRRKIQDRVLRRKQQSPWTDTLNLLMISKPDLHQKQ